MGNSEISNQKAIINKKYLLIIIIFFVLYCLFLSWSFWFQNVDDAYISFRYGKNLMDGHGLVYNPGEYVEGYTNFLWTVITAPFTKIKSVDISIFALSLGLIFSIINIFILTRITRQFSDLFPVKPAYLILLPAIFFVIDDSHCFLGNRRNGISNVHLVYTCCCVLLLQD